MASSARSMAMSDLGDPFNPYIPPNETPEEKKRRIQREKEAKKHSEAIDRQLKAEKEEMEKTKSAKLLLLGSSESGKTTVLKQLKIIHGNGLEEERRQYARIVHLNVLTAMKALTSELESSGNSLDDPKNEEHLEKFQMLTTIKVTLNRNSLTVQAAIRDKKSDDDTASETFREHSESIQALWSDAAIRKCFEKASNIGLQDSAKYFLDHVERFAQPDYVPTDDDILQARVRTIGVTEHEFRIKGSDPEIFRIFDVGGHRSQRQYWAPYFDDVNAIIFMAAVSAFDQVLEEDSDVNRMRDSLQLFDTICNHPLFINTSIILFLNKIDILKKKIQKVKVKDYFEEYKGANDFQSVTKFFQRQFLAKNSNTEKHIYVHFTHATDTKQMRVIVASVNDIVQRMNLKASGLI
ncbi:9359_t:CDS:2 [Ambispora leptoticha]|uniref:9359_t:CDS:1 n=1 Tax=Ambispora leptoticha TaxID=144679 RepID=A0A9N9BWH5_9GLOM|nr:9359_t:CDS:2 [Ambispora leptoticha]